MNYPVINSYTNWGRLEEVWLGDVYPASFYDNLESEVRDVFYDITEKTQQDLKIIENKIKEFGVVVRRPTYGHKEEYISTPEQHLKKPCIMPRDNFLVSGNNFFYRPFKEWDSVVEEYKQDSRVNFIRNDTITSAFQMIGANTVRAGRDIYIDFVFFNQFSRLTAQQTVEEYQRTVAHHFKDYRVHLLFNGGPIDGCFAAVAPGVLLTSRYFNDYDRTFPGWKCIEISKASGLKKRHGPGHNGKWWMYQNSDNKKIFNQHVIKHALDWVGNYTETIFEVNSLVIDEKNIIMLGENEEIFRALEQQGITAHSVPFRTRSFWDGGLHCLTMDIRRQDSMIDLFPDRTQPITVYHPEAKYQHVDITSSS